jgi:hypothetical protein
LFVSEITMSKLNVRKVRKGIAAIAAMVMMVVAGQAQAQFAHAVVVMKGAVLTEEAHRPISVKVSVRVAGDTASEITSSLSNKESGKYLVVLKPGHKYWFHLEGDSILTKDVLIETPTTDASAQIVQDIIVTPREEEAIKTKSKENLSTNSVD